MNCTYCGEPARNCPNADGETCCMGCFNNDEPCLCGTNFTCLAVHHDTAPTEL